MGRVSSLSVTVKAIGTSLVVVCALVLAMAFSVETAHAVSVSELSQAYQAAIGRYQTAIDNQASNAAEIESLEAQIREKDRTLERTREQLSNAVVSLYKGSRGQGSLLDLVLGSSSFYDAVMRMDTYEKVENYYYDRIGVLVEEQAQLNAEREQLEIRKHEIESEVENAKQAADEAEQALKNATHADGAKFHQKQGDSVNCGATAFTVAVNTLLHDERYPDNVAVWKGAGFEGNSITNLAGRARTWLKANGLGDQIEVSELAGDIHKASEMRAQLEEGNLVIASSGSGSVWQRANGGHVGPGQYTGGHWIVFYHYENGTYYANDSAVGHKEGAGCPYTEEQLQQWLDGRGNHFATVVKLK